MQEVHILTSRILSQQRKLGMVTDNMANLNTIGYKKLELQLKEVASDERGERIGNLNNSRDSFVGDRAITINFQSGALNETSSTYDVAILGEGFFGIDNNGRQEFTRNGHFLLDNTNTLVTAQGFPVQSNTGGPITIPTDAVEVNITREGIVSTTENGEIGQIGVFVFAPEDINQLQRTGFGGFAALPGVAPRTLAVDDVNVVQGSLENSNVNPALEMIQLQELSQAYQGAARLMNRVEELESQAIRNLGGGGGR